MGVTDTTLFTERQNAVARICKALAHPARVAIVEYLLEVDQCIGGDIVDKLPLAQPTISRHLRELRDAGILKGTIDGTRVNYCINKEKWQEFREVLDPLLDADVSEQDCC